jgi:cullin-associated NEDD8-dissociated protein 1
MTALTLELCCTMMVDKKHHSNAGAAVRERVLPQALVLVKSSLLQGQALQVILLTILNLECGDYFI